MRVRPTLRGVLLGVALVLVVAARPPATDPVVAGFVWAAFAAVWVVGAVWPVVAVQGVRARVVAAPTDLLVGDPAAVTVEVTGGPADLALVVADTRTRPTFRDGTTVELPLSVDRRGVLVGLRVDARSEGPFGIVRATRRLHPDLPGTLWVGPSPMLTTAEPGQVSRDGDATPPAGPPVGGDTVRAVRPYVPGDPAHLVHWPTTARTGALVVRELEPPAPLGLAVVADLTVEEGAEGVAARASGLCRALLGGGSRVVLCTHTLDGPVAREVRTTRDVDRTLAAAMPGPPASPPRGWPVERIEVP